MRFCAKINTLYLVVHWINKTYIFYIQSLNEDKRSQVENDVEWLWKEIYSNDSILIKKNKQFRLIHAHSLPKLISK